MASSLGPDGGFGHVMKIFIGAGFPCMGFPGYILCLYVVACNNVYFSLIIMLMLLTFNLTYCYLLICKISIRLWSPYCVLLTPVYTMKTKIHLKNCRNV